MGDSDDDIDFEALNARELHQRKFVGDEPLTNEARYSADLAREIRNQYARHYLTPIKRLATALKTLLKIDVEIHTNLTNQGIHVLSQHLLDPFPPQELAPDSMRNSGNFVGLQEIHDLLSCMQAHAKHAYLMIGTTRHANLAASFVEINDLQHDIDTRLDDAKDALDQIQTLERALFSDLGRSVPSRFVRRQPTFDPFPHSQIARDEFRNNVGAGGSKVVEENHTPDGRLIFGLTDARRVLALLHQEVKTCVEDATQSPEHVPTHNSYRFDEQGTDRVRAHLARHPLHIPARLRARPPLPPVDLSEWPEGYDQQHKLASEFLNSDGEEELHHPPAEDEPRPRSHHPPSSSAQD